MILLFLFITNLFASDCLNLEKLIAHLKAAPVRVQYQSLQLNTYNFKKNIDESVYDKLNGEYIDLQIDELELKKLLEQNKAHTGYSYQSAQIDKTKLSGMVLAGTKNYKQQACLSFTNESGREIEVMNYSPSHLTIQLTEKHRELPSYLCRYEVKGDKFKGQLIKTCLYNYAAELLTSNNKVLNEGLGKNVMNRKYAITEVFDWNKYDDWSFELKLDSELKNYLQKLNQESGMREVLSSSAPVLKCQDLDLTLPDYSQSLQLSLDAEKQILEIFKSRKSEIQQKTEELKLLSQCLESKERYKHDDCHALESKMKIIGEDFEKIIQKYTNEITKVYEPLNQSIKNSSYLSDWPKNNLNNSQNYANWSSRFYENYFYSRYLPLSLSSSVCEKDKLKDSIACWKKAIDNKIGYFSYVLTDRQSALNTTEAEALVSLRGLVENLEGLK
ncbi:MAG: hypothetical protein JNM93_07680 [Bacteriovoracaceae bacterium]|nr:hypothetical protein [Bacteriovoracaceae bacterium]